MRKYLAHLGLVRPLIIIKETAKTFFFQYEGALVPHTRRCLKSSDLGKCIFDTWEDARNCLVSYLDGRIQRLKRDLAASEKYLEELKQMREYEVSSNLKDS